MKCKINQKCLNGNMGTFDRLEREVERKKIAEKNVKKFSTYI